MKKVLLFGIIIYFFVSCFLFSGCQALSDYAVKKLDKESKELIEYFDDIGFYYVTGSYSNARILRWEAPVNIKLFGKYTDKDYSTIKNFIGSLNGIKGMPKISIVDRGQNYSIYFLPVGDIYATINDYNDGDWDGSDFNWDKEYKLYFAQTAIASDVTSQKQRNYLLLESMASCLGIIYNDDKYPDSIFYSKWNELQSLSHMDYKLLGMLYSDAISPGMTREKAEEALKPWLKAELLENGYED